MDSDEIFVLMDDPDSARVAAERLFESARLQIRQLLGDHAEIIHVGATSIPGCLTKGDLDIVVRVDPPSFVAADEALAKSFARNDGSLRSGDFSAFEDGSLTPHLGIQLTAKGGALDGFHRFADALRADKRLMQRYNDLKRAHHNRPMKTYRIAKDAFVAEVLEACG